MKRLIFSLFALLASVAFSTPAWADGPTLKTDKDQYGPGESVSVQFSGLPGNKKDLLTLVPADQSEMKFGKSKLYSDGQAQGELRFEEKLKPGKYEVRLYFDYPAGGYTVHARYPFEVFKDAPPASAAGGGESGPKPPSVEAEKATYYLNEPIVVKYAGLPGNDKDWITLVTPDVPPDQFAGLWRYTRSKKEGVEVFNDVVEVGDYEIRLYFDNGYQPQAVFRGLKILDPPTQVSTDKESYQAGDTVTVKFSDMPGYKTDWIAVVEADAPDYTFDRSGNNWKSTNGAKQGELVFDKLGLKGGAYQVRAYYNFPAGKYNVKARIGFKVEGGEEEASSSSEEESTEEEETEEEETEEEETPEAQYPFVPPPK